MTRRDCILAVALAIIVASAPLHAQEASVRIVTPSVSFGSIVPGAAQPQLAIVALNVVSSSPWRLSASLEAGRMHGAAPARDSGVAPVSLFATSSAGRVEIRSAIPATLAEGTMTPPDGTAVTIPVELEAQWSAAPHRDNVFVRLQLNGVALPEVLRVDYEIRPQVLVAADSRSFVLKVPDVTHPSTYWFEPRVYHVTANTPWQLSVWMKDDAKIAGTDRTLKSDALVARSAAGEELPLRSNKVQQILATGGATGPGGVDVQVTLGLRIDADEVGGAYNGSISVDVTPVVSAAVAR